MAETIEKPLAPHPNRWSDLRAWVDRRLVSPVRQRCAGLTKPVDQLWTRLPDHVVHRLVEPLVIMLFPRYTCATPYPNYLDIQYSRVMVLKKNIIRISFGSFPVHIYISME